MLAPNLLLRLKLVCMRIGSASGLKPTKPVAYQPEFGACMHKRRLEVRRRVMHAILTETNLLSFYILFYILFSYMSTVPRVDNY
jgi:hypothetical protein